MEIENLGLKNMEDALTAVEILAKAFNAEPFELYILGGAGCVLAKYLSRATRDFDIIDLGYSASLGLVMKPLEPFDLIDMKLATLSPGYKQRAVRLEKYTYLSVYVLSREDIIVSKLARLNDRDLTDIRELLPAADVKLVFSLADEILNGDLLPKAKTVFIENLTCCMEEFGVSDYLQQFEELRKRL